MVGTARTRLCPPYKTSPQNNEPCPSSSGAAVALRGAGFFAGFGSSAARLLGEVTVQVDVFTNYGRPNEQHQSLTIRLREAKDTVKIGDVEF